MSLKQNPTRDAGVQESAAFGPSIPHAHHSEVHVLTATEVARELRCSKAHLSHVINGKVPNLPPLPVLRIGRRVLVREDALREWLERVECRITTPAPLPSRLRRPAR